MVFLKATKCLGSKRHILYFRMNVSVFFCVCIHLLYYSQFTSFFLCFLDHATCGCLSQGVAFRILQAGPFELVPHRWWVGGWTWNGTCGSLNVTLCPAGPACLDLVGLSLIHPHHRIGPKTPVTGLLWGQYTPLPWGGGRWGCGDWLVV